MSIFDHETEMAKHLRHFYRRWSEEALEQEQEKMEQLMMLSLLMCRSWKTLEAHWQSMAVFRLARELEWRTLEKETN